MVRGDAHQESRGAPAGRSTACFTEAETARRTRLANLTRRWVSTGALWALPLAGCGSSSDVSGLYEPWVSDPGPRPAAFLGFPREAESAPRGDDTGELGFPRLLSQTLAFQDLETLTPATGLLPYEIAAPLWSDGADKRRWMALPEGTQIGLAGDVTGAGRWQIPEGTVFIKHFEMAMDERSPDERRRLETRLWVVGAGETQYGVAYKWNEAQTDAELLLEQQSEVLSIIDAQGTPRAQPYFYPGPSDCYSCHSSRVGFVLGPRVAQLNRTTIYDEERPPVNQLVAWSGWGYLDTEIDGTAAAVAPRLASLEDESASLEDRVRSYWEGNCAMCHAGSDGSVSGWDARFATPFEEQGLDREPNNQSLAATRLIEPGAPEASLIYLRADTVEPGQRMPPLGRNRVDDAYLDVLASWISSLE